jgi:hypothetical protein
MRKTAILILEHTVYTFSKTMILKTFSESCPRHWHFLRNFSVIQRDNSFLTGVDLQNYGVGIY